jgi:hypothetical protein
MKTGIILLIIFVILIVIINAFRGIIKYKALLEKLLSKGYLTEEDENKLNKLADKHKITKKTTDEIRSQRMKKDTQEIINRIYSNEIFSDDDEKQIKNIANKHRINVEYDNPDFRKFRTYWMRSNTKTHHELKKTKEIPLTISSIKTKEDYEKLNKRIDFLNNKYESTTSNEESIKIEKEIEKLDNIWNIAREKVWGWQFIPECSLLETDDEIFDFAYKIFENKNELKNIIKDFPEYEDDFIELTFDDEPEEKPAYIETIRQIYRISREDIPLNEILNKIDKISKPYEKNIKKYISDNQLSVGQFVVAMILENENAPIPFELVKEGLSNREDYLKIEPIDFGKRKGVGPKTVQQLIDYQNFVKNYDKENDWNF